MQFIYATLISAGFVVWLIGAMEGLWYVLDRTDYHWRKRYLLVFGFAAIMAAIFIFLLWLSWLAS